MATNSINGRHETSVDGIDFEIVSLTVRESLELTKKQKKLEFFGFLVEFIDAVTTLDQRQIKELKVQSAIAIMVYHRMYFWDNEVVSDNPVLTPKDFLRDGSYDEEFINISGYRFSNIATLSQMADAERLCYLKGDSDLLCFYLLAGLCQKNLKSGLKAILDEQVDSQEYRESLKELNTKFSAVGSVSLDLLQDTGKISIRSVGSESCFMFIDDSSFCFFLGLI